MIESHERKHPGKRGVTEQRSASGDKVWRRDSWRSLPAQQQPAWPDGAESTAVRAELARLPALVSADETRTLQVHLAAAGTGDSFVLQAGDCAETFDRCHGPYIHDLLKVILHMAVVLVVAGDKRIVTIGRFAGQYAKPRSTDNETNDGLTLPVYRGDMVNGLEPTLASRRHDPRRMLEGYFRSAATLNLVHAFTRGGSAALNRIGSWGHASFGDFRVPARYQAICAEIDNALKLMTAPGNDPARSAVSGSANDPRLGQLNEMPVYTSHEALLLDYEEAMVRSDPATGRDYDASGHFLWIGDRTRQLDGAHVEFLRGVGNPIGVKLGPTCTVDDARRLCAVLNPDNEPGRLSLITRIGSALIGEVLPPLVDAVKSEGCRVTWICDPMHGNTVSNSRGRKVREFAAIVDELQQFWQIHRAAGTPPGGVHLELSASNVTECIGGTETAGDPEYLPDYQSACDPRLNAEQAVNLAFVLAGLLAQTNAGSTFGRGK